MRARAEQDEVSRDDHFSYGGRRGAGAERQQALCPDGQRKDGQGSRMGSGSRLEQRYRGRRQERGTGSFGGTGVLGGGSGGGHGPGYPADSGLGRGERLGIA